MIFQFQNAKKNIEILNDLVMIQNERIAGYHIALESTSKEPYFNKAIQNAIKDGLMFKYKLIHKIHQMEGERSNNLALPGKLYKVWKDLKMKLVTCKRREVIAKCQYNEVIALHVANAAINSIELDPENRSLIEDQEAILRRNMNVIRQYNETLKFDYNTLMYFN